MGWAQVQVVQGQEEGIMVVIFHLILLQEDECVELLICITHHMNTLTDCSYCSAMYMYTHTQLYTLHTLYAHVMLYSHAFCVS